MPAGVAIVLGFTGAALATDGLHDALPVAHAPSVPILFGQARRRFVLACSPLRRGGHEHRVCVRSGDLLL
jgi:hypothetical protein